MADNPVNIEKCHGRCWEDNGIGHQCPHNPKSGSRFCGKHHNTRAYTNHGPFCDENGNLLPGNQYMKETQKIN